MIRSSDKPICERLVCLMYHNVCRTRDAEGAFSEFRTLSPSITSYFLDADTFDGHCRVIADSGQAIGFTELNQPVEGALSQQPRVLLTFDDGWRDCVDIGGPILAAHELQALLLVTTDLIGHPDFVGLETLRKLPPQFSVGSHARTHRMLSELSDADVRAELQESKTILEDILEAEVDSLAYPGGSFDRRVETIATELGYRWIFTSEPGVSRRNTSSHRIGRIPVKTNTSVQTVTRWLQGNVRREQRRAIALKTAKRLMGRSLYRTLRTRLLSEKSGQLEMTDLTDAEATGVRRTS